MDYLSQPYSRYQIRKKVTAAAYVYGVSENHTQETDAKVNTAYALQSLTCAAMEDKDEIENLTSINLTLFHILKQAQEKMLVLSNQIQALQTQAKSKTPTTEIPVLVNNTKYTKSK